MWGGKQGSKEICDTVEFVAGEDWTPQQLICLRAKNETWEWDLEEQGQMCGSET